MNIVYVRMEGYHYSVPSDAVAREIERLGHHVTIVDNINMIPHGDYDFVWSPYESVTLLGQAVSKKLNVPHFSHIEWLPPWRLDIGCDPKEYGFLGNETELHLDQVKKMSAHYELVGRAHYNAEISTIGGQCFIDYISKFLNVNPDKYIVRYPSIDVNSIKDFGRIRTMKKIPNSIITIARAAVNKRYDLLLHVMNRVTVPCTWKIIGNGPMLEYVKGNLNNDKVTLELLGPMTNVARLYQQQISELSLHSWSGMPPMEGWLVGCFPLMVDQKLPKELTGSLIKEYYNSIAIYEQEEIYDKVPKVIDELLSDPVKKEAYDWKFIDIPTGGITSARVNAEQIIERMKQWLS